MTPEQLKYLKDYQDQVNTYASGNPQKYASSGTLDPYEIGDSKLGGISTDPKYHDAELAALQELSDQSKNGFTASDLADIQRTEQLANKSHSGRVGSIQQGMQSRGLGGSGLDLMAQLQSSQDANEMEALKSLEREGMMQDRKSQATKDLGSMSSQLQGRDWQQQAAAAQANDEIAKFNAQNRNTANQWNAANNQQVANNNVSSANQWRGDQLQARTGAAQIGYNAATDDYNQQQLKKQQKAQKRAGMVSGVLGAAGGIAGGVMGSAAGPLGTMAGASAGYQAGNALGGAVAGYAHGGRIPGQPDHPGIDTAANDDVQIDATPGEIVIPLSAASSEGSAMAFVKGLFASKKSGGKGYASGGYVSDALDAQAEMQRLQAEKDARRNAIFAASANKGYLENMNGRDSGFTDTHTGKYIDVPAVKGMGPIAPSKYGAFLDENAPEPSLPMAEPKPMPKPAAVRSKPYAAPQSDAFAAKAIPEPILQKLAAKNPGLVERYRAKMAAGDQSVQGAEDMQDMLGVGNVIGRGITDFANSQKKDLILANRFEDLGKQPTVIEAQRKPWDDSTLDKLGERGVQRAKEGRNRDEDSFFREQQLGQMDKADRRDDAMNDPNSPDSQSARAFLKAMLPNAGKIPGFDSLSAAQLDKRAGMLMEKWKADRAQGNFNREMGLKEKEFDIKGKNGKVLPAEQAGKISQFKAAEDLIDQMDKDYKEKASGFGSSLLQYIPGTDANLYRKGLPAKVQAFGTALEGGKLTDKDYDKYEGMSPAGGSTASQAKAQVGSLRDALEAKKNAELSILKGSGYNVPDMPKKQIQIEPMDQQAFQWARSNQNDPRAHKIVDRLREKYAQ